MNGYIVNLEKVTLENTDFRRVLYTAPNSQLVLMNIKSQEDIGEEVHTLDQFIRIESGEGKAILNGKEHDIKADDGIVIPAGTRHNVVNTGSSDLKLYTVYSPPEHIDGTTHATKQDALSDTHDEFDGKTTE